MSSDGDAHEHIHTRQSLLEQRHDELSRRMDMQYQATQDLLEAWNSARALLNFVQLLAKVGAACAAIYLFAKGMVHIK